MANQHPCCKADMPGPHKDDCSYMLSIKLAISPNRPSCPHEAKKGYCTADPIKLDGRMYELSR